MEKAQTKIPFNYVTIKITKSRINKGLLAIPVSLTHIFPKNNDEVYIVDEFGREERNKLTPYSSSSKECRIGGMRNFYEQYRIQNGDELVVQVLGDNRYRVIPEKIFEHKVKEFESQIDKATKDTDADTAITKLAEFVNEKPEDTIKNEFIRLGSQNVLNRKVNVRDNIKIKEGVPPSLRRILLTLYQGRCQISGFSFLMKTGEPYFELHHIYPMQGNHIKNLLVVSPNVHAQFTHAKVRLFLDNEGWLRNVKFNDHLHKVFQIIDEIQSTFKKEIHCLNS